VKKRPKRRKPFPRRGPDLPTEDQLRPNPRAVDALEGVLDAAQEFPEELRELVLRGVEYTLATLLGVGASGTKKPFSIDTGDGVAVIVRPLDARAVAVKALSAYGAGLLEAVMPSTRGRARAAFKEKLARRRSK
jgi:hypothetical protein